jgi:hypothetical protein
VRYLLHIGRHKTGTSSLQHFLFRNRGKLEALGFHYPESGLEGVAHHAIAHHFALARPSPFEDAGTGSEGDALEALIKYASTASGCMLLSSEAFQNCDPRAIEAVFRAGETDVVVYLREQVDYLVSAYQQRVHGSSFHGSLDEFARQFNVDYSAFLGRWADVFGADHLHPRLYGRGLLKDDDIVSDFCATAGIECDSRWIRPPTDRNPSIGGALLEFKRLVNAVSPLGRTERTVYRAFSHFATTSPSLRTKPVLAVGVADQIRGSVRESNRSAFERFPSLSRGFELEPTPGSTLTDTVIGRDALIGVAQVFASLYPAEHEALLRFACDKLAIGARTDASSWALVLDRTALVSNRYPDTGTALSTPGLPGGAWPSSDEPRRVENRAYVESLYRAAFRRLPNDSETDHWMKALDSGLDPRHVPALLMAEKEYERIDQRSQAGRQVNALFVEALYRGILHRQPKARELEHWLKALGAGADPHRLAARLTTSEEFGRIESRLSRRAAGPKQ